ncbi:MAG: CHASE2 domain-containing protein [Parafilimonas sp.]|nr:CHASE2 domain-containing protein [Parafilimonas sp.]
MKKTNPVEKIHVLKESFIASAILLFATYIISFIPWSLEYGKALHQGFADFDIYDLYYSEKNKQNTKRDSNIVLVQLDTGRNGIAQEIEWLNKCDPKAIAIDAFFEKDSPNDSAFKHIVLSEPNIIFLNRNTENGILPNIFYNKPDRCGFANFIGNKYSVVRAFYPRITINGKQYDAFAACIARLVKPESYNELSCRNNEQEIIDYKGNLESYTSITADEVVQYLAAGQLQSVIKNKIVLLGFFEKDSSNIVMDDLHYTPLNEVVSGKSYPDMYGVVIHANILSMILSKKYPTPPSAFISYLFAFVITFVFNYYIISRYSVKAHPSHAVFLIVQVFVILFVLYFFLKLYDWFLFKVSLEPIMIALVLSLEFFGIYESLAVWLNKKFQYITVFNRKHPL